MLIITGTGRSGTSVLTRFCHNMGYRTGGNWSSQVDGGMEEPDIVGVNNRLLSGEMSSHSADLINTFDRPVIKDPLFINPEVLEPWLMSRNDLRFLILLRKTEHVVKSRQRHREWFREEETEPSLNNKVVETYRLLSLHEAPVRTLSFPEFLDRYDVVRRILTEFGKLSIHQARGKRCWDALIDPDRVHIK